MNQYTDNCFIFIFIFWEYVEQIYHNYVNTNVTTSKQKYRKANEPQTTQKYQLLTVITNE